MFEFGLVDTQESKVRMKINLQPWNMFFGIAKHQQNSLIVNCL